MPRDKYGYFKVRHAAEITGKTRTTIRRWAKAGLDLANDAEILAWNEKKGNQRNPVNLTTPHPHVRPSRKRRNGFDLKVLDKLPDPSDEGAPAALKRLQGLERIFYARLLDELNNPGDRDAITAGQRDYDRVTESLRKYEKEVALAQRELGHLISKGEAIEAVRTAANWLRLTWMTWISSSLQDILAISHNIREAKQACLKSFDELLRIQLEKSKSAKYPIPDWAEPIILEQFRIYEPTTTDAA